MHYAYHSNLEFHKIKDFSIFYLKDINKNRINFSIKAFIEIR